jgi:hypothetical protein
MRTTGLQRSSWTCRNLGKVDEIRDDLVPVLASTDSILTPTDQMVIDLRPQIFGLAIGLKVVGGKIAQTMRGVHLATWQQIGKEVPGSASNINI